MTCLWGELYLRSSLCLRRDMDDERELQRRMQRVSGLVQEIEQFTDPAARAKAKELMQAVMDLHSSGLERVMEIVFNSGEPGARIIAEMSKDPLVSSLLVLYGLHPDELATRVTRAIESLGRDLRVQSCNLELLDIHGSEVRVRITPGPHTCGSTSRQLRTTVEDAICGAAPDVTSLVIEGLDGQAASGFVSLDKLLASPASTGLTMSYSPAVRRDGAD